MALLLKGKRFSRWVQGRVKANHVCPGWCSCIGHIVCWRSLHRTLWVSASNSLYQFCGSSYRVIALRSGCPRLSQTQLLWPNFVNTDDVLPMNWEQMNHGNVSWCPPLFSEPAESLRILRVSTLPSASPVMLYVNCHRRKTPIEVHVRVLQLHRGNSFVFSLRARYFLR